MNLIFSPQKISFLAGGCLAVSELKGEGEKWNRKCRNQGWRKPYRETTPEETVDVFNTIMQINLHLRQEEEDKKGSKWEAFFVYHSNGFLLKTFQAFTKLSL